MINFCKTSNLYQFDLPHHNLNKARTPYTYNQLFVDDLLYVINTKTGEMYTNTIDFDKVDLLKLYNWSPDSVGRFQTGKDGQIVKIHELVYGVKTSQNYVINHINGVPSNNKLANLEVVTQWFNSAIQKKASELSIGILYANGESSYKTQIKMSRVNGKVINFGSKDRNYLQNLHYQFGVRSGLVTSERYGKALDNWKPDPTIEFTPEHQNKLNLLIEAHIANQSTWDYALRPL
jgi:HNH endonuclease